MSGLVPLIFYSHAAGVGRTSPVFLWPESVPFSPESGKDRDCSILIMNFSLHIQSSAVFCSLPLTFYW